MSPTLFRSALAAMSMLAGGLAAFAEGPQVGDFLYADPAMVGSIFERSVVVLVEVNRDGAVGLIVNKPTRLSPRGALPLDGARLLRSPLYLGGPVATDGVSALLRLDPGAAPGTRRVLGNVYFATDVETLQRALQEGSPDRHVRLFAGYSGWGPGQLQQEIADGQWVVAQGRVDALFSDAPEELWQEVYRLLGRIEARYDGRPRR